VLRALITLVVAACGSGVSGPTRSALPTQEPGARNPANQGGTVVIGVPQALPSLLAAGIVGTTVYAFDVDSPAAEGLLWYRSLTETSSAKVAADYWAPDLATEVPTVDNGDVLTSGCRNPAARMCVVWKLRAGVRWHDGSRFTSADVCATWQLWWLKYKDHNPTFVQPTSAWKASIGCVEASALEAVISFDRPVGSYLALGSGVYGILPARLLDTAFSADGGNGQDLEQTEQQVDLRAGSGNQDAFFGNDTLDRLIDGTGPYVLQKYEPGKDAVFVPNRNYWDKTRPPHLAKVVFKFLPDVAAEVIEASAGSIDVGLDYGLDVLNDLQAMVSGGRVKIETVLGSGAEKIDLNICASARNLCGDGAKKSSVLADKRFRHALLKALNRQQYAGVLTAGASSVPLDSALYLGAAYIGDPATGRRTAYDAAGAAADLDKAGYHVSADCGGNRADPAGGCISLDLLTISGSRTRAATQAAVQSDLARVGIPVTLSAAPARQFFAGFAAGGPLYSHRFDMALYASELTIPGEPDSWYPVYHADCGGACSRQNQIPSAANNGQGQDATGEADSAVDKALDAGGSSVDDNARLQAYRDVEEHLADDLPELPIYQYVTFNTYGVRLRGLTPNDLVWTYDIGDWYCLGGNCQA
jgi:peptide/nickel transport system substrate-binding protein